MRWAESVKNFRSQGVTLCGDVLLISAFVSYVGYFTKKYRNELMERFWIPYINRLKVSRPARLVTQEIRGGPSGADPAWSHLPSGPRLQLAIQGVDGGQVGPPLPPPSRPGSQLRKAAFTRTVRLPTCHSELLSLRSQATPHLWQVPIPTTEGLDPLSLLTDDADVATWNNQGLPSDRMSTENATILCNTERWPLIVDAQLQGVKWIKNKYGHELKAIRLGQKRCVAAGARPRCRQVHPGLAYVLNGPTGP